MATTGYTELKEFQRIEVVVTVRHREIASARTELTGEVPRNSGEVDFTNGGEAP